MPSGRGAGDEAVIREQIDFYREGTPYYDHVASPSDGEFTDRVLAFCPVSSHCLELASGSGRWTVPLLGKCERITAVDASPEQSAVDDRNRRRGHGPSSGPSPLPRPVELGHVGTRRQKGSEMVASLREPLPTPRRDVDRRVPWRVNDGDIVECTRCGGSHEVFTLDGVSRLQVVRCTSSTWPVGVENERIPDSPGDSS